MGPKPEGQDSTATAAILRTVSSPVDAAVPRLWADEVRNSVLMGVRRKRITMADAQEFLTLLKALPIRLRDPQSYDEIFTLAGLQSLTVYDAPYLDLALREGLPLASLDKAMRNAALQSGVALFAP